MFQIRYWAAVNRISDQRASEIQHRTGLRTGIRFTAVKQYEYMWEYDGSVDLLNVMVDVSQIEKRCISYNYENESV